MATRMSDRPNAPVNAAERINTLKNAAIEAANSGDVPNAITYFEQLLAYDSRNAEILSNLGKLYYMAGDFEMAVKRMQGAWTAAPENEAFRTNYLSSLVILAANYNVQGKFAAAIPHLRKVMAIDPGHMQARVELTTALEITGARSELSDFMPNTAPDRLGRHVLIACMPKSGSSFLKEALCGLTGWPNVPLTYAYLQNEQELYLPNLVGVAARDTVTQQHCRATGPNVQIMQAFGIRPVVLVRRLADIVVSYADFFDKGATMNTYFADVWPTLDQQAKYDVVIDHQMPWYASFYASWERVARRGQLDCLFVTYEEMTADKPAAIDRIAGFLQLGKTVEECAAAVRLAEGDAVKTRFNKGDAGRGDEALNDAQKARLRHLFRAFGDLDLERVGLAA